jgi:hypothetical protein
MHIGNRPRKKFALTRLMFFALLGACGFVAAPARADAPSFTIEFHDGKISPLRIEVPANQQFKIEFDNTGSTPAEFESHELHKEKVLAAKSRSFLVFHPLNPGEYSFFDDFHPGGPKPVIVAK